MHAKISPIISPEDVHNLLSNPNLVIIDARGGDDAIDRYAKAHLEGAKFVSLERDLSDVRDAARGGRHPLPSPQRFGRLLGQHSINAESHILVYDDKNGANAAARFWWMLRASGHKNVQVIDGGLRAIQEAGLPVSGGASPRPDEDAEPYPVSTWMLPLADLERINQMRADNSATVIDVRESYRYRGESEPIDLVAGHIPGAVNMPYVDNLRADGRFRLPEELSSLYSEVGASPDVAVHCGSGVTACHTILAMELAGLPIPRLYVGSWSEWSRNPLPIATGDRPGGV